MDKKKLYEAIMKNVQLSFTEQKREKVKKILDQILDFQKRNGVKSNPDDVKKIRLKKAVIPTGDREDWDTIITNGKVELLFEPPLKKYVIYIDNYHGGLKHIASYSDMLGCSLWGCDDFEDFAPNAIVASFDTLEEAAAYALVDNGVTNIGDYLKNMEDDIFSWSKLSDYYDSVSFIENIIKGQHALTQQYFQYPEDPDCFSFKEVEKLLEDFGVTVI